MQVPQDQLKASYFKETECRVPTAGTTCVSCKFDRVTQPLKSCNKNNYSLTSLQPVQVESNCMRTWTGNFQNPEICFLVLFKQF